AAAAARARTQRPGKHLAVHAPELAVEPGVQIVRRYCGPLLLCLEHAHRSALEDLVRRPPRLGKRGLSNVRIGISPAAARRPCLLVGRKQHSQASIFRLWRVFLIAPSTRPPRREFITLLGGAAVVG